jgi:hypothetical protein
MSFIIIRNCAGCIFLDGGAVVQTTFFKQAGLITLLLAIAAFLSGCGAGTTTSGTGTGTGTGTGSTTTPTVSTLTLALVDSGGTATTSISTGNPGTVNATLLDATGAVVPNTVVTFVTDATLTTMSPVGGTALTNTSGVASVTLNPASFSAAGATTITATAQVDSTTVTGSIGYSIGASTLTMSAITLGAGSTSGSPLSAFGTTSVSVTVSSGGVPITSPQTVTFTSSCAASGKAVLTASVTTVSGVAIGSYRDNGCAGSDVITASVSSLTTPVTATIYVTAPIAGSLQYYSSTPSTIGLSGTGGTSSSQVAFKVVDGGGNPVSGKDVVFGLSTTLGGITLTPATATGTSDTSGLVYVNVNAGTMSTPVRVTARTCTTAITTTSPLACSGTGTILSTQSSELTITTGIPSQSSFSISATTLNIEGWNYDGTETVLTARLADHFSNPVPDGTAINFISEGARVVASCVTAGGNCSAVFNSQDIRPPDGRVTVLGYVVGEESFVDLNASGVADKSPNELIVNGSSTDMGEAYVDYDENGIYNSATEPYFDFNQSGSYSGTTSGVAPYDYVGATSAGDGDYNGILCDNIATSSAGTCSATKTIHARKSIVIVLSGSTPYITTDVATLSTYSGGTIDLDPGLTGGCGGSQTINVRIVDLHGNLMPAGTTVLFSANKNGAISWTGGSYPVENANTPIASLTGYNYSVGVQGDGSITSGVCSDTTSSGTLTVKITTPKGNTTTYFIANLIN